MTQYLCQFYTGLESCFEKVLKFTKVALPSAGEHQHRKLLTVAIDSKLVPDDCVDFLDDLLSFRHFARRGYGVELKSSEILEKAALVQQLWPLLRVRIESFLQP